MRWYKDIPKDELGNKYELIEPVSIIVDAHLPSCIGKDKNDNIVLMIKRNCISIMPPYRWDGATCAPDFESVLLPSLVHDILYDAIKSGYILTFEIADAIFMSLMKETDFPLKNTYYSAVRRFGEWCRKDLSTGTLTIENFQDE